MSRKPIMVDLFCGLGGWAEVAEMLDGYEYEYDRGAASPMMRSGLGGIGGFFNERAL